MAEEYSEMGAFESAYDVLQRELGLNSDYNAALDRAIQDNIDARNALDVSAIEEEKIQPEVEFVAELPPLVMAEDLVSDQNGVYRMSWRWSFKQDGSWNLEDFKNQWKNLKYVLNEQCSDFIFQLELTGGNNWHYQGYAKFAKKIRPKQWSISLNGSFPGIEAAAMRGTETVLKDYCMKEETRQAGPWGKRDLPTRWDVPTTLWQWQKDLESIFKEKCLDPRSIYWVWDKEGGHGKTAFCKYMGMKHKTLCLSYSTSTNLLNMVFKAQGRRAYFFDLTRTKPKDLHSEDLYSAFESIKNGYFMNSKYETGECFMDPPHICVFSNQLPDTDRLTLDRWKIYELKKDEAGELKLFKWNIGHIQAVSQAAILV